MNHRARVCSAGLYAALAAALLSPLAAFAQDRAQSLEEVLQIARTRAPLILSAKARIEEAKGRLAGASVRYLQNPLIEANGGPRISSADRTTALDFSVSQEFELGGRRAARIAGARAGIERESAASDNMVRSLLREVSAAFIRGLAAQERMRLLTETERIALDFLTIAEKRFQAGDIPLLEVNLSRTTAARARSESRIARGELSAALGELRVLLGMQPEESLAIRGQLRTEHDYQFEVLKAKASDRPDIRALLADLREAESEVRLGAGYRLPDLGVTWTYQRDDRSNIYQGGVRITLPVFSRGQELTATGTARAARIRGEIEALRRAVHHEIATAYDVYQSQMEAANEIETGAIPSLNENEVLARRSYEEGEIGLSELLLIRREILETRLAYVTSLLGARMAGLELEYRAGVLK
jgi:cobalt-zinc-cadmium efflux system outer membrane protein